MSADVDVHLQLFVAGEAPNSLRAAAALRMLCRRHFPNRHLIEVVDVFEQPARALESGILLTPQLVFVKPPAGHTIIGDLSDLEPVMRALGVENGQAFA